MLLKKMIFFIFAINRHILKIYKNCIKLYKILQSEEVEINGKSSFAAMDAFWLDLLKPLKHKPHHEVDIFY